ncbi:protein LYRIC-like isoform X1 [Polypterus senegalus]|uniref:protein LYRIC-like isoform X1 n=1 Tax=Polypterus senegalus TaxID=55291 RepID=UPI0019645DF5|nr:protein LYRIC-like isoform X1 [Polypterus senegalus]
MAAMWREAAAQQAEVLASRLRELLSVGVGLLRSEVGVDLGLQPELYPSWVILLTAFLGLLVVVLMWAAACTGRKREARIVQQATKAPAAKSVKPEESKKKGKKKPVEKQKPQPNGRAVVELQEDAIVMEEVPKQHAEMKTEKNKNKKKKMKTEVKNVQNSLSVDGKETDDGAWETKISNKEKRQQRRRDKVVNEDAGVQKTEVQGNSSVVEHRTTATAAASIGLKKNKGEPFHVKSGKGDGIISHVSSNWAEAPVANGGGWTEMAMKLPAPISSVDGESWVMSSKATSSPAKRTPESAPWGQESESSGGSTAKEWPGSWMERRLFNSIGTWGGADERKEATEKKPPAFSALGLSASVTEQSPQTIKADFQDQCLQEEVDYAWSGISDSANPDWVAPSVEWGNCDEQEATPSPESEEPALETHKVSDDDKEKLDNAAAIGVKSKKKKKKKKKQGEESSAPAQLHEEQETSAVELQEPVPSAHAEPKIEDGNVNEQVEVNVDNFLLLKPELPVSVMKESSITVLDSTSQKIISQVPQRLPEPDPSAVMIAKQNSVPPPTQTKSEENWESPKQVKKKKKARRET